MKIKVLNPNSYSTLKGGHENNRNSTQIGINTIMLFIRKIVRILERNISFYLEEWKWVNVRQVFEEDLGRLKEGIPLLGEHHKQRAIGTCMSGSHREPQVPGAGELVGSETVGEGQGQALWAVGRAAGVQCEASGKALGVSEQGIDMFLKNKDMDIW